MSGPDVPRFNRTDPLPEPGLYVLEASAGTGKTFTIAELVRRFVAEGVAEIGSILAMTFGRSATQELRDRIRRELQRFADSPADPAQTERARTALADFDRAGVMTIHEFCTDAFARFGVRADADPGAEVGEDLGEQVVQTAHDVYVDLFADDPPLAAPGPDGRTRTADLGPEAARRIAKELAAHPDAELITAPVQPVAPEQQRVDFARTVRVRTEEAKRRAGLVSFDDLVLRLRQAVRDPMARQALRGRFRVVLVDEFQDTDPTQWAIVRETFVEADGAAPVVVLIGDPKQGIYSFRGADIHAYTEARDTPGAVRRTLATNYRSDGPVIAGVLDLLRGIEVGDGIVVGDVGAHHRGTRIDGPAMDPGGRRVRLRVCRPPKGTKADRLWEMVASDVVAEIQRTLRHGAAIALTGPDGTPTGEHRPISAGDFAVIVRTNDQAALVHGTLRRAGIPAVVNSQVSVFTSRAAWAWLALLRAMEHPSGNRLRVAALSEFIGADPARLATDTDALITSVASRVAALSTVFTDYGIPAVLGEALRGLDAETPGVYEQMLSRVDGERFLTDLRHVAGLLHEEHRRSHLALTGLADWLAAEIADADSEAPERSEALTRRLDSDADAVQVVTVHRCKGLQYAIAYVPFGSFAPPNRNTPVVCTTDLFAIPPRMRRVIDVRSYASGSKVAARKSPTERLKEIRQAQARAEDLRMLYVALTRAVHEVVITWAMAQGANRNSSPLHRALSATSGVPDPSYPSEPPVAKARQSAHVVVESVPHANLAADPAGIPAPRQHDVPGALAAAPYDRADIDTGWTRASFTGLTRQGHRRPVDLADETVLGEKDDEPVAGLRDDAEPAGELPAASGGPLAPPHEALPEPTEQPAAGSSRPPAVAPGQGRTRAPQPVPTGRGAPDEARLPDLAVGSPMAGLPAGRAFGTLVHSVLETVDTSATDLAAEVLLRCREQMARRPVPGLADEDLAHGLLQVMQTPLGRLAPGWSLARVQPTDRLAELDFELPMHSQATGPAQTVASIGELLAMAVAEPAWVRDYGEDLRRATFSWKQLRGYLTGSIDAVLRVDGRCIVVDYKTNHLGSALGAYHPAVLPAHMAEAHYPLQALLYSVALHRFLRLRLPGYDPGTHLGGILYAFVRGMAGPGTPVNEEGDPCGVFAWRPGASLVTDLSALLGGERL